MRTGGWYAVTAVDNSYNESSREIVEVEIPDNVAPDPPSALAARPSRDGAVLLSWQPLLAFDLAGYRVYRGDPQRGERERSGGRQFSAVAELDGQTTNWMDREVERGQAYRYYLTALDESGNESDPSAEVEIVPTDILAPEPPREFSAEVVRRGVRLSWQPSPEEDVKGYRLYRSEYPGGRPSRPLAVVYAKTEYLDRRGSAGLVYAVSTIDTSGNEGARKEVTAQ